MSNFLRLLVFDEIVFSYFFQTECLRIHHLLATFLLLLRLQPMHDHHLLGILGAKLSIGGGLTPCFLDGVIDGARVFDLKSLSYHLSLMALHDSCLRAFLLGFDLLNRGGFR